MEDEAVEFRKIDDRCSELKRWITLNAPQCLMEEKHLIEGTQERGYWALGYLTALLDVQRLFSRDLPAELKGKGDSSRTPKAA
jgi:hypothetical protein